MENKSLSHTAEKTGKITKLLKDLQIKIAFRTWNTI
jgi:hypothetical protein